MIGRASAKDPKLLGLSGDMLPLKNFEILDPQIAGNALKFSILPSPRYFVSFQIFCDPIKRTLMALAGVRACVILHSTNSLKKTLSFFTLYDCKLISLL